METSHLLFYIERRKNQSVIVLFPYILKLKNRISLYGEKEKRKRLEFALRCARHTAMAGCGWSWRSGRGGRKAAGNSVVRRRTGSVRLARTAKDDGIESASV
jgi:hypothetical protein